MKFTGTVWFAVVAVAAVAFGALSGCSGAGTTLTPTPDPHGNKSLSLGAFSNCQELESEVKQLLIGEMERTADLHLQACKGGLIAPVSAPAQGGRDAVATAEGSEVTSTNVQEAGVDEADLLKSDGKITAAIVKKQVLIAKVWPLEGFGLLARITPQATPSGLYLAGSHLIVLSQIDGGNSDGMPLAVAPTMAPGSASSGAVSGSQPGSVVEPQVIEEVYDVSDPVNPVKIKSKIYYGSLLDSRRVGSALYLVIAAGGVVMPAIDYDPAVDYEALPDCPDSGESQPNDQLRSAVEDLKQRNAAIIEAATLAELMPHVGTSDGIACQGIARSGEDAGTNLLAVAADAYEDASASPAEQVILGNGGTVYASADALYVAAQTMPWGWWGTSESEWSDSSIIHRFLLQGSQVTYAASVKMDGHLVDNAFAGSHYSQRFSMASFAMSEYQGTLRVATTVQTWKDSQSTVDNRVQLFSLAGNAFAKVGEVADLGSNEHIRAVRFLGDRGYVVTFKKTDPLFVLDLANPAAPALAGKLEVPGFSTYLHPLSSGQLIGLGFDVQDEGSFAWTQGLKLALFDVSDPANPALVGDREFGGRGSYTPAVEEHHAFTLDPDRKLIALPIDLYEGGGGSQYGTHTFSGVIVLRADDGGAFATVGTIAVDEDSAADTPWSFPSMAVLRTAIVGADKDTGVITLCDASLRFNRLDATMSEIGRIQ